MNSVNKTLYIPLYGKAYVSRKGLFLKDPYAEKIWEREAFPLGKKSSSKWLAYYMGIRSAVFDDWTRVKMAEYPDAVVLHIGCGMDSRVLRVGCGSHTWYDLDFSQVLEERRRYFSETEQYRMISCDLREKDWLCSIPDASSAIVVMEGVSMYLTAEEMRSLLSALKGKFSHYVLLADFYSVFAAKMSKYKNPVKEVGVSAVYGMDDAKSLEQDGIAVVCQHDMTPARYINQLKGMEKWLWGKLYAGKTARGLYRLYEYKRG